MTDLREARRDNSDHRLECDDQRLFNTRPAECRRIRTRNCEFRVFLQRFVPASNQPWARSCCLLGVWSAFGRDQHAAVKNSSAPFRRAFHALRSPVTTISTCRDPHAPRTRRSRPAGRSVSFVGHRDVLEFKPGPKSVREAWRAMFDVARGGKALTGDSLSGRRVAKEMKSHSGTGTVPEATRRQTWCRSDPRSTPANHEMVSCAPADWPRRMPRRKLARCAIAASNAVARRSVCHFVRSAEYSSNVLCGSNHLL
jgi:hypothetical protein